MATPSSTTSIPFIDLSGTFHAQKKYLNGLQYMTENVIVNPGLTDNLTKISSNLDTINSQFQNAAGNSSSILTNQQNTLNIVNTELNRLNTKKDTVDSALQGQKRIVELNDSYRQKYNFYIKIMILFVILIIIYICINLIKEKFPDIPGFVFDISYVLLFILFITFMYYTVYLDNIINRDNLNFSELNYISPNQLTASQQNQQQQNANSKNLLDSINLMGCVGNNCCDPNTSIWDEGNSLCVGISHFSPYSDYSDKIKSDFACEGNQYSFLITNK
jgi:glucan phosphoethanolaminetransferase (alkaline phosphatase superfamily)